MAARRKKKATKRRSTRKAVDLIISKSRTKAATKKCNVSSEFYGALGMATPREVLVLPIYGEDRLEVVLYADGGPDASVDGTREDFLSLLAEVDRALRMLSCKHRPTGVATGVDTPAG